MLSQNYPRPGIPYITVMKCIKCTILKTRKSYFSFIFLIWFKLHSLCQIHLLLSIWWSRMMHKCCVQLMRCFFRIKLHWNDVMLTMYMHANKVREGCAYTLPANIFYILENYFCSSTYCCTTITGRYSGVVRNERNCKLCNMNVCESEYHFLPCCPAYNCLRCTYKIRPSWSNLTVLVNIMSSHNIHTIHNLSKYIVEAMQIRNNGS